MRNRILSAAVAVGVSAGVLLTAAAGTASAQTSGEPVDYCRSAAVGSTFMDVCFSYEKVGNRYNSSAIVRYATKDASAYVSEDGVISYEEEAYWASFHPDTPKPTVFRFKVCNPQKKCSAWT